MSRAAARRLDVTDQPLLPISVVTVERPLHRVAVRAHRRRVDGPPPPTGAERRNAALLEHESKKVTQQVLGYVRSQLVALYHARALTMTKPYVTADDVETILRDWPDCPDEAKPSHGPQHWRGTVFRGRGWRQTGQTVPSLRPHMNATALPCWEPVEPEPATTEAP